MLFRGSRRGRNIGQGPQSALKDEYNVTIIFKPNADLNNITGNIANLCKYFTKEYHITIVGGPRKNNYEIEKRISDIGTVYILLVILAEMTNYVLAGTAIIGLFPRIKEKCS
jgi:hypothetical protein